jgi:23S rRNA (adenine2503-C2)-methyltransferase
MTRWKTIRRIDSRETTVRKYVFEAVDAVAEAVLYGYPDHRTRTVICCSTQSGCPIGCRFCGSGDSFVRSLAAEEIVEQVRHCVDETGVDPADMGRLQVMFMSMGEPLLNRAGLIPALRELHRLYPRAALLISTSAPDVDYDWLDALSVEISTIGLQFSVHESTDEARDKLVPFKRKLALAQMADAGYRWHEATGRQPFFNYCAHEQNTSDLDAARLADLFSPAVWQATISVVCERDETVAAANARQRALAADFQQKLRRRGFSTRMFDPAGQDDVGGGCGQLWFVQSWMAQHPRLARPSVGRALPVIHAPRLT